MVVVVFVLLLASCDSEFGGGFDGGGANGGGVYRAFRSESTI